ncbi:Uma2 family endonuclease [Geminocystis sp. GBBB08]|uniref:Uma2 family endonuclease n=1 Tax=Geminocystis sp. GBBB08 TaxID=2604140 RepID=UPI0027E26DA3|nr:Uma2 family endonuclease [Geminocystis sp. GBBB08]MBL1211078.1 Uma2 family endonuclease [Geminocystis sp. GBBB08]
MVAQLEKTTTSEIIYPDSDGKQMADNTLQFRWITTIKSNLDWLFADNPQVFVAGDLLWYPVEGDNKKRVAPDVMVVFGREKGERGSYHQWKEDNISPQVVFEILSPGNTTKEMYGKLLFYQGYGVEEYYIYDPNLNDLTGFVRQDNILTIIEEIDGWKSPRLGIRFQLSQSELTIYYPNDESKGTGDRFSTYNEEKQKVLAEKERAEKEKERAEKEKQRADKLEAKLRELGIDLP